MKFKKTIFLLTFLIILICCCCLVETCKNKDEYSNESFSEEAAKQLVKENLYVPSSAIFNESTCIESYDGQYIVFVEVEASNKLGVYIRERYFVLIKSINLSNKTFKYNKSFALIKCEGKSDTINLNIIKNLNNYYKSSDANQKSNEEEKSDKNIFNVRIVSDSKIIDLQKVKKNSMISEPPEQTKENSIFLGWFIGEEKISFPYVVTEDITIVAKWKGVECKYKLKDESNIYSIEFGTQEKIQPIKKEGYNFLGWYCDGTKVTNEKGEMIISWKYKDLVVLIPKYEIINYTREYVSDGGGDVVLKGEESEKNNFFKVFFNVENNYTATITAIPREGYRFVGWSDGVKSAERTDTNIKTSSEKAIEAKFIGTYSLKFKVQDEEQGEIEGESFQIIGEGTTEQAVVVAKPKYGYKFKWWEYEWYSSTQYIQNPTIVVTGNSWKGWNYNYIHEYTAVFEPITYQAKYKCDKGYQLGLLKYDFTATCGDNNPNSYRTEGVHMASFTLSKNNQFSSPKITAVPNEGCKFVKWSDGVTTATRQDIDVTKDIEIVAYFVGTYTIIFKCETGGTIIGEKIQVVCGGSVAEAVTAKANRGYSFKYWKEEGSSTNYSTNPTLLVSTKPWDGFYKYGLQFVFIAVFE